MKKLREKKSFYWVGIWMLAMFTISCDLIGGGKELQFPVTQECRDETEKKLRSLSSNIRVQYNKFDSKLPSHPDVVGVFRVYSNNMKRSALRSLTVPIFFNSCISDTKTSYFLNSDLDLQDMAATLSKLESKGVNYYILSGKGVITVHYKNSPAVQDIIFSK